MVGWRACGAAGQQAESGCKCCEENPYMTIHINDNPSDSNAVGTVASKATASLWGLLQAKGLHGCCHGC